MTSRLDKATLTALVGILAARPLMPEVFSRLTTAFVASDVGGPTPATSTWLDFVLIAVSAVVLWRHRLASRRPAFVGSGLILLALAVGLSTWGASDRRVALNAAAELFAFAAAGIALARLVSHRADFAAILVAAAIASAGVNALKCSTQAAFEFRDTLDAWNSRKAQLVVAGRAIDDPTIVNFERRLRSAETFGYLAHPNVAASVLAAAAACLIGIGLASFRRRGAPPGAGPLVALALAAGPIYALSTTGSTGAATGLAIGAAVAAALVLFNPLVAARPSRAAALFLAIQAAALALLLGYGIARSTLPGTSLAFRWEYWTAAGHAYAEAPLTGIGRENFAPFHMKYKPPSATEEVRNPHNFWISMLVETGPSGAVAAMLLIGGGICAAFRRFTPPDAPAHDQPGRSLEAAHAPSAAGREPVGRAFAGGCALAVLATQALFGDIPFASGGIAIVWTLEVAAVWLLIYVAMLRVVAPAADALRVGGLAAAAALLTHNLIDFSLITPSGLSMLVLLLAGSMAAQRSPEPPPTRRRFGLAPALLTAFAVVHLFWIARPTQHTANLAARSDAIFARTHTPASLDEAYGVGLAAIRDDGFEAALPAEIAGRYSTLLDQPDLPAETALILAGRASLLANLAMKRDERNPTVWALLGRIFDQHSALVWRAGERDQARPLALNAAALWDEALTRYPTNPRWRIDAAAAWLATLPLDLDPPQTVAARSAAHLDAALAIDATRTLDNASRLRPAELDRIRQMREKIAEIPK